MPLNPLNELKRRLEDDSTPLPKRFCLAKNVIQSHYFPTAPKERVVADWLLELAQTNNLTRDVLKDVLEQLTVVENMTGELKSRLIKIASDYIQRNPIQDDDIKIFLSFIENNLIATQLQLHINEYLTIAITLLQYLRESDMPAIEISKRILINIQKFYVTSKKKLDFIVKFLSRENIETVFNFLHTECHDAVILLCSTVLFPLSKKSLYATFLQTILRKDNIDELMAEKGDNIQSVLKVMTTFFSFPNGRTTKDPKFLSDFIEVYVSCFHEASQIIFAFYIMVASSLNMDQSYLLPAMKMPPIIFEQNDEKIKRNLFLKMLETLLHKEVDVNIRLTDTFGEKMSKVEIKKNFASFLQAVMIGQLKLVGKIDKTTMQIIKTSLKLDPVLIEQKMTEILPQLMVAKKNKAMNSYQEMINCLLEILFKLSRGITFVNQILPNLKVCLEASNTEQFELKQKIKECIDNGVDCEKLKSKIISGQDIFPDECVEVYGKCTSELMFRQNGELLLILQKDFEENCLMMLEEGFVSPSIIVLAEVLSAILCSYFEHSKMADHTVPQLIAENFWNLFKRFEDDCLKKFGECVLKLNYNPPLVLSFLKLCLSYSQLKLLNINYSNYNKLQLPANASALDLSYILPCMDVNQWSQLAAKIDDDAAIVLNKLFVVKTMAMQMISSDNIESKEYVATVKNHLIKNVNDDSIIFENLDKSQAKTLAKSLVKACINNDAVLPDGIKNSKDLLNAVVLETCRNILKCFPNTETLTKALNKTDFNIVHTEIDLKTYLNIKVNENQDDVLLKCIEILKLSKIYFLEEMYQLAAIFVLLTVKKCCNTKKIKRQIDYVLQSIFELSPKYPDVYKIFPVEFIFSFDENNLLDLFTLKIKTSNQLLILKSILELAVKKVKTDSDVVKNVVDILVKESNKKSSSNIHYFNDAAFQVACLILPIIAKEKKAITTSNYRSILANLQEELHKRILVAFKNMDFSTTQLNDGNTEDSVTSESVATLNAMDAYSLTLLKYCESNNADEFKKLDYLWSSLDYFTNTAINTTENPDSRTQHIQSSIQLLNILLRYIKRLEAHDLFNKKDELFSRIWRSLKSRLFMVFDHRVTSRKGITDRCLEDVAVTIKFLCEISSLECFSTHFVGDLAKLMNMKDPSALKDESNTVLPSHKVTNYFITQYLKANIVGPKGVALCKLVYNSCKKLRAWIHENYEKNCIGTTDNKENTQDEEDLITVKIEDSICEIIKLNINNLSEVLISAKKISLDYKFLDCTFELQHMIHFLLGCNTVSIRCDITWEGFFTLYEGSISILNSLLVSREELLEDRWPCYMQCYRALVICLCERSAIDVKLDRDIQEKLAEMAHSVEKLTQSMCKRKTQVSRLAAYTVADFCSLLADTSPYKMVRQHLENSVAILIQASDSTYAMAFLRRALAGTPAQLTMTRLYTMYKRYHKYVGNA